MSRRNSPKGSGDSVIGASISVLFMMYWCYIAFRGGAPVIFYIVGAFGLYTSLKGFVQRFTAYRQRKNNPDFYDYAEYRDAGYTAVDYGNTDYGATSRHIDTGAVRYCPYCGGQVQQDYAYCPYCGSKLY
ncbi:MAG: zinc ribbon domain-containing protein [Oscillospiraceae bacterium]|nr:zinc ribbon domain-containing protein [Oscillospiraceae bacterium]